MIDQVAANLGCGYRAPRTIARLNFLDVYKLGMSIRRSPVSLAAIRSSRGPEPHLKGIAKNCAHFTLRDLC